MSSHISDLSFNVSRNGNSLDLELINEGEALYGPNVVGSISFAMNGSSFNTMSLGGAGGSLSRGSIQIGSNLDINFNAAVAGQIPVGSPLLAFSFDLTRDGSISLASENISLDGSRVVVEDLEPVTFEFMTPLIARDDGASATQDGPEISGNVLSNDDGDGLTVTLLAGAEVTGDPVMGNLGTLTMMPDGTYSYVANDATALPGGVTAQDRFTYTVSSVHGEEVTARLAITVTGVNDPASISGELTGLVVEDDAERQAVEGTLVVTDPDDGGRFCDA